MYIFLDESGDLGFDLTKKGTSKFFIITILVSENTDAIRTISVAAHKALKKINQKKKSCFNSELKGTETPLHIKQYFFNKINNSEWCLYATVVNKRSFRMPKYITHPNHLYNYIAAHLLNNVVVSGKKSSVVISVDKCKMAREVLEFNRHVEEVFYAKLDNIGRLVIKHEYSHDDKLVQATDLFCNGLFCKYEQEDLSWYSCFKDRIYIENEL